MFFHTNTTLTPFLHHTGHTAHTAHTTHAHTRRRSLLLGVNNTGFASCQQASNTGSVDEGGPDDLQGVEDTGSNHVSVLRSLGVVTPVELFGSGKLIGKESTDDNGTLLTGVLDDGSDRSSDSLSDHGDTEFLVKVVDSNVLKSGRGFEKSSTTTGDNTFLDGGTGGVESIVVPVLLLSDLNLARATNLDNGNTAAEFGQSLLELGPVVVGSGRVVDQSSDLLASRLDEVLVTLAVEDDGVLLGNGNGAGGTEHVGGGLLKLDVELVSEDSTAGEDGNITEDRLSVVTKAGGLDGGDGELTSELVEDDGSESLTVNVLGDDQQRSTGLGGDLKRRKDVLKSRDLLLGEEDEGLLELDTLVLGVGDEVRGDEASVESHTLGNLNLVVNGSTFLDGDDTLLADLLHGLGNDGTDVGITVGGDGGNLGNLLRSGDDLFVSNEDLEDLVDSLLGTSTEIHGVAAGSDVLHTLRVDGSGEDSGGGGTVTGGVVGLGSNVLDKTSTEVLNGVLESDSLGDRDTVLGDLGPTEALADDDGSALGAEGGRDGLCEDVNTLEHALPGVVAEDDVLGGEAPLLDSSVLDEPCGAGKSSAGSERVHFSDRKSVV